MKYKYKGREKEYKKEYYQKWKKSGKYNEYIKTGGNKEKCRKYKKKLREKVLSIISNGKIECTKCGCDKIELLEINHKNGKGNKERKEKHPFNLMMSIYKRERKTDDLEILCKVCNSLDHLKRKYGELPYEIRYCKNKR